MSPPAPASKHMDLWTFGAIVIAGVVAMEALWLATVVIPGNDSWTLGMDYRFYRDVGVTWLSEGTYYLPHQLAGPYEFTNMVDVIYPPQALALFVPFAVLPALAWWIVPIALLAYGIWRAHPPRWAWLIMLVLLAWPRAIGAYLFGNTDIWVAAGIAAGAAWGWPAALLALKPTALPLAILSWRCRSFWLAVIVLLASAVVMAPLVRQYVTAMANLRIDLGYSLGSLPLVLVPVTAIVSATVHARRIVRAEGAP